MRGIHLLAYKQLLFNTFDPEVAPFYGVRTGTLDTIFALVLAAAIIASMRILGVTMIAAAIVIPPISARMLTDSFSKMLVLNGAGRLHRRGRHVPELLPRRIVGRDHRALRRRCLPARAHVLTPRERLTGIRGVSSDVVVAGTEQKTVVYD